MLLRGRSCRNVHETGLNIILFIPLVLYLSSSMSVPYNCKSPTPQYHDECKKVLGKALSQQQRNACSLQQSAVNEIKVMQQDMHVLYNTCYDCQNIAARNSGLEHQFIAKASNNKRRRIKHPRKFSAQLQTDAKMTSGESQIYHR